MAYNGSGIFNIDSTGQPVVATTLIEAATFNAFTADVGSGLSTAICKDGQTTITANIPFNNKKITGLASATTRTDATNLGDVQDGTGIYVGTVGGTADVITLTPSPAITAYAAGQTFRFIASGANTTNVTVNVSGLGAKALTKNGTTALVANDVASGAMVTMTYDGTRFILGTLGAASYLATTLMDAKGDLIAGTAADTAGRVALGTDTQSLLADSSQSAGLRWGYPQPPTTEFTLFEDFHGGLTTNEAVSAGLALTLICAYGWEITYTGTAGQGVSLSPSGYNSDADVHPGQIYLQVGAAGSTNDDCVVKGRTRYYWTSNTTFDLEVLVIADSGYGTTSGTMRFGLIQSGTGDGIMFECLNSDTNWFYKCQQGYPSSASTRVDSGVAKSRGDWRKFRFVTSGTTQVDFTIDGANAGSITTNLPGGTADELVLYMQYIDNSGGSNDGYHIDYIKLRGYHPAR